MANFKTELQEELKEDFKKEPNEKIQNVLNKADTAKLKLLAKNQKLKEENKPAIKKKKKNKKKKNCELRRFRVEMERIQREGWPDYKANSE